MIAYDNSAQFTIIFQLAGSVIPQSLPIGAFTGAIGLCLAILRETGQTQDIIKIHDPFAIQVLATVVGYLIVVRTNMALRRWMDGISDVQEMLSKWGDAYNTLIGFFSGKEGPPEMQKRILLFRVRVAHWFSLMSCLAFATLRGGSLGKLSDVPIREMLPTDELADALMEGSTSFTMNDYSGKRRSRSSDGSTKTKQSGQRRASSFCDMKNGGLNADVDLAPAYSQDTMGWGTRDSDHLMDHKLEALQETELVVLHRPSHEEVKRLEAATDAVNTVCLWIIQGIILEIRAKTLDTPPPIVTRVFQELSNGMLGFSQAHKVAMVPFPFPFAQMVSFLLLFFYIVFPFYVDMFTQNPVVTVLISTLVPICYNGLNCLAIELEEPFGCDSNDVDIEVRHEEFNKMLIDTIRQPSKPPTKKEADEMSPEDKITRGISRGIGEVFRRVDGMWPWELVTSQEDIGVDRIQLGSKNEEKRKLLEPEAPAPSNGTMPPPPNGKEATDISEWAEESHLEEGGNENGYHHKTGLLCGNRCEPDTSMTTMRMVDGDLEVLPE